MIRLSRTPEQQLAVMELLAGLEAQQRGAAELTVPGTRQRRISHELVLFQAGAADRSVHKPIPAGEYQVDEILVGRQRWLVLKGESWGNVEAYWEAVQEMSAATRAAAKRGLLSQIVRLQESVVLTIKGKPWRRRKEEARLLHKEANQLIRQGDWGAALPFLQKAAAEDPDNYEIAYRLVQAARLVGASANPAAILSKVLNQSRWTEDQKQMLKQLNL
jgi:tetratricopeptide (TPR) repeat protein